MTKRLSDEARREAERRWSGVGRGVERETLDRATRYGFVSGAEWRDARDQERIEALEAEVERLRAQLDAADRQIEARTGETAGERLWKARAEQADSERDAAIELMQEAESDTERAEALLARIREFATERIDEYPDDPYDFVWQFATEVIAIMDGDNT